MSFNILKTLDEMRRKEMEVVDGLEETIANLTDPFLKTMMTSMINDSKKHAEILQSLIDYKKGKIAKSLQDVGMSARAKLSDVLRKHEMIEGEAAEKYSELAKKVDDPLISSFLELIANDERQHHRLMTYLFRYHTNKSFTGSS